MVAMNVIPSLSKDGWISSSEKILDFVISHYILTDTQQTLLYKGALISLPYTYFLHNNKPESMAEAMADDLRKLLTRYFAEAEVSARAKRDSLDDNVYTIFISAAVIDKDNKRYELSKVTQLLNSKAKVITSFNNVGLAADHYNTIVGSS